MSPFFPVQEAIDTSHTTHYLEEAEALSDHVGIMAAGRLQAVGTPEELKQRAGTSDFEEAFIRLASEKGAA